ncbi:MAG: hypothetical protein M3Y04_09005 [Actinomycetota bacterium]|nr:hypothetical protein [Actinomycetota bacterium]
MRGGVLCRRGGAKGPADVVDHGTDGEVGDVAGAVGEAGCLLFGHPPGGGVDGDGHGHGRCRFHPGVGGAEVGQADRVVAPPGQQAGQEPGRSPRPDRGYAGSAPPEPGPVEVPAHRPHQRAGVEVQVQVDPNAVPGK